ncbi:MAG: ComF family protein [Pseudomonas sp.]|uniref:ComF family protein n=1 Tax=Pseudomonas abieticivorans TaxID=2931382 RepID=UPI0020BF0947|nr:ComF family protein [Pseudomonas sp. PIA16]MDE1167002.1 ComF family protein [Pseudomonas sp.]
MNCQPGHGRSVYIWSKNNHTCLLCDEPTDQAYPLCVPCEAELPWLDQRCERCALPLPITGMLCGACNRQSPAFTRVEAPWHFGFPLDALVNRFKHHGRWPIGRLLSELLGHWLAHRFDEGLPRPGCLLPVPMGRKRLRQRGYNQAAMVAGWLGKQLNIPCDEHMLLRPHDTQAQQELNARARLRNLQGAFTLAPGARIKGRHLALVDDVLTTGATAQALALLLLKAGAARVDVYCLARTPKPGSA